MAAQWAATLAASSGVVAEFDPTTQPTRGSFWAFLFVAVALALLMVSMVRHLRRARENLGAAEPREHPGFPERPEVATQHVEPAEPTPPDQSR